MPLSVRYRQWLGASLGFFVFHYFLSGAAASGPLPGIEHDYGISPKFVCTPIPPEADPSCYSPPSVPHGASSNGHTNSHNGSNRRGIMSDEAKATILHLRESLVRQKETILDQRETIRELTAKLTLCEGFGSHHSSGHHDNHHNSHHENHHDSHHDDHHGHHSSHHASPSSHHGPSAYHSSEHHYSHVSHRADPHNRKVSSYTKHSSFSPEQTGKTLQTLKERLESLQARNSSSSYSSSLRELLQRKISALEEQLHSYNHDNHDYGHHKDHHGDHHDGHHSSSHLDDHHDDHHSNGRHDPHHDDHHGTGHHDDHHGGHASNHHDSLRHNHHSSHQHNDHHYDHRYTWPHSQHHGHYSSHPSNHHSVHRSDHHGHHADHHHDDHHDYPHSPIHHYSDHHDDHLDNEPHGNDHHDDHHGNDGQSRRLPLSSKETSLQGPGHSKIETVLSQLHHGNTDHGNHKKLKSPSAFMLDFPMRTNYMFARMKRSVVSEIFALTVGLWLKAGEGPGLGTPFSYAVPGQANELVLIEWGNNPMELLISDKVAMLPITLTDGKWHHVCVTWTTRDGVWEAYQDGVKKGTGQGLSAWHPIKPGGTFILGQEQDTLGGRFDVTQSFMGELSDLQIWSRVLTPNEIHSQATCGGHLVGDIMSWSEESVELHGGLTEIPFEPCH
ncbi:neuronal pentraxin-2-like [Channa argus]|uniref:neuronal pentraxin-2-like n=1 Tax=Channa argus TaxID=215402 RepID=UPI00352099A9